MSGSVSYCVYSDVGLDVFSMVIMSFESHTRTMMSLGLWKTWEYVLFHILVELIVFVLSFSVIG